MGEWVFELDRVKVWLLERDCSGSGGGIPEADFGTEPWEFPMETSRGKFPLEVPMGIFHGMGRPQWEFLWDDMEASGELATFHRTTESLRACPIHGLRLEDRVATGMGTDLGKCHSINRNQRGERKFQWLSGLFP